MDLVIDIDCLPEKASSSHFAASVLAQLLTGLRSLCFMSCPVCLTVYADALQTGLWKNCGCNPWMAQMWLGGAFLSASEARKHSLLFFFWWFHGLLSPQDAGLCEKSCSDFSGLQAHLDLLSRESIPFSPAYPARMGPWRDQRDWCVDWRPRKGNCVLGGVQTSS